LRLTAIASGADAFDEWLTKAVESTPQERYSLLSNWYQALVHVIATRRVPKNICCR
jgi:hypothetical protein